MVDYTNFIFSSYIVGDNARFFLDVKTKAIILPYINNAEFPLGSTATLRHIKTGEVITEFADVDDMAFHLSNHSLNHEMLHILLLDQFGEHVSRGLDKISGLLFAKEGYGAIVDL